MEVVHSRAASKQAGFKTNIATTNINSFYLDRLGAKDPEKQGFGY